MQDGKLRNKPLVEALLELRWDLPTQVGSELPSDPHYRLLLGRFSERIESAYPFHEALPTAEIPDAMAANVPQHRFRVSRGAWPLIQMGPGIMTVNETNGYEWATFRSRCESAVEMLFDAHPSKGDLHIHGLTLRYIDAVDVDFSAESVFDFLRGKMKLDISLPPSLFEDDRVKSNPSAFNWQVSFPHQIPGGLLTLRFAMGTRSGKPGILWETLVQTERDSIPQMPPGFHIWLENAHSLTHDWFFKMIQGELDRRFSGD